MFSPSIDTIASVSLRIISCFWVGVKTPSINRTLTSGIGVLLSVIRVAWVIQHALQLPSAYERTRSAAAAALSGNRFSRTRIAAAVCCSAVFGGSLLPINFDRGGFDRAVPGTVGVGLHLLALDRRPQ